MTMTDQNCVPFSYVLCDQVAILAVDDDPIQREFCAVYLATPHAEITTVGSAEEGLTLLEQARFDVALIDVDMPGMDGIEMVRRLRADRRFDDLPLMVITGREDIVSIDQAYAAGATSFMCKPVNWRLLGHQIRFLVRAHRALAAA
ncbi:response regulator [Bosea sp. 124]|uniref:response regulator n=1 Tax=Bosea sp. 124 TaxID=2135642 RepID=UPI000D433030|nr:response regulator [Bosea sp. 124]PTM41511.1 response regulator receiver domain-containing protein [Bosea sp. 124]